MIVEIVAVDGGESLALPAELADARPLLRLSRADDGDLVVGQIDADDVKVDVAAAELLVVDTGPDVLPLRARGRGD